MAVALLLLVLITGCNEKVELPGKYLNTKYYMDAPMNILSISRDGKYSMVYPSVLGEKQLGEWVLKYDTLVLWAQLELVNNFKDTIVRTDTSIAMFRVKGKKLRSLSNNWVLKRE
ncbi:MAG: hypothetical protein JO154_09930 [Chitinophaga sp.]|uniref:hypothetical protein n=1 Tax=Chitinophaga sp. TaxID=1869181 RepID=UPI0025C147F1|nr:hypothetical protein [Chitinophaga sp.]MBV8252911.1 hypothetical protein [Chitinophaga sp.]